MYQALVITGCVGFFSRLGLNMGDMNSAVAAEVSLVPTQNMAAT